MLFFCLSYNVLAKKNSNKDNSNSQYFEIDSIKTKLSKFGNDTNRIKYLLVLSEKYSQFNNDSSYSYANQAYGLSKRLKWEKGIGYSYFWLGKVYLENSDIKKSQEFFDKSIQIARKLNLFDLTANNLNSIGSIHLINRKVDEAKKYFEEALVVINKTNDKIILSRINNNLGRLYEKNGDYETALKHYQDALKNSESINYYVGMSRILTNMGNVSKSIYKYSQALDYYTRSIEISEKSDDKMGILNNLISIASLYDDTEDFDNAIKYYQKALTINKSYNNKYIFSKLYQNLGNTYKNTSKFNLSIESYKKSLIYINELNDFISMSSTLNSIAGVYLDTKNYKQAMDYYNQALEINEKLSNNQGIFLNYANIGKIYSLIAVNEKKDSLQKNQLLRKSIEFQIKALEGFNSVGLLIEEFKTLIVLASTYKALNDYENAYYCQLDAHLISDSVKKLEMEKEFEIKKSKIELKNKSLEIELKEKELTILEKDSKYQKTVRNSLIGVIFLVLVITTIIIYFLQKNRKINKLLNEKNEIISYKNNELIELNAEKDKYLEQINKELKIADRYVQSLIPQPYDDNNFTTFWSFVPSSRLGGDSFGYHWIDNNNFAIYLLDVCGHGIHSALHSVSIINILKNQKLNNVDFKKPEQVLYELNNTFQMSEYENLFFTMWYGVIKLDTKELVYSGAGHPPAFLFSSDQIIKLQSDNFIIGGIKDYKYISKTINLQEDSIIYLYSDGVYEVEKSNGNMMDLEELLEYLKQRKDLSNNEVKGLLNFIKNISKKELLDDDFSILKILIKK